MPILSHHCERLLIENCPKKIIHNFCVPPLQTNTLLIPESALLNSQKKKKKKSLSCSTINNMRIWEKKEMLFHEEREEKKGKARKFCFLCTVHTYNLSLLLCVYI